jgi:hypothetical protein
MHLSLFNNQNKKLQQFNAITLIILLLETLIFLNNTS